MTSRQLLIPGSEGGALVPKEVAFLRSAEAALSRLTDIPNARTRSAYRTAWDAWGHHCAAFGLQPLPIKPVDLIQYLEWLRDNADKPKAPNTVRLALSALASLDQAARVRAGEPEPLSIRSHPVVRRWLTAWSKDPRNPRAPRKKAPAVQPDDIEAMIRVAAEPPPKGSNVSAAAHAALYTRDRCMLLLGVCGAMRVSELVALDVADVIEATRGLRVLVRRGKTDQHGEGHLRGITPQAHVVRCPVDAFAQWMRLRGRADGPLFVAIERNGALSGERLCIRAAQYVISRRAKAAGLELVSSHSMRASFATLAAERGKPLNKIADQGGWSSLNVLRGYVRQGELFDNNPSAGLLDD